MPYSPFDHQHAKNHAPIWIYFGGASLSAVAGYVNVLLLKFFSVPVSHMTGAFSRLSIDLGSQKSEDLKWIISIIGGFLLGACLSGIIIGSPRLKSGRRYGLTLMLEGIFLAVSAWLIKQGYRQGVSIAAMACGLQNGMASSYYGLVLRTTHVTGIITDIGVFLGQWIRRKPIMLWKLALLLTLATGFFVGGLMAIFFYEWMAFQAMYLGAFVCFFTGLIYFIYMQYLRKSNVLSKSL